MAKYLVIDQSSKNLFWQKNTALKLLTFYE